MYMRALIALSVLGLSALLAVAKEREPLEVVPSVDFNRYAGLWYEIARLPNRFQKGCAGDVTANYVLLEGGGISVINQCRDAKGGMKRVEGRARLADKTGPPSKLKVRFAPGFLSFLPFVWGDYWIIDLAPDYSYAVVGEPGRDYLWILSRSPEMDEALLRRLTEKAAAMGFDTSRMMRTRQTRP
jgi:apolipoprotein D and lipocalin family protein